MSTIITRNSANSGSTPASLVQGELAINVTDGRLFYGSGSGNVVKEFTGSASGGTIDTGSFAITGSNTFTGDQIINGENLGLIVDASGLKRVGFMKYGGLEGSIARVANQNFRILRTTGSNINDGTDAITDFYIAGDGKVGIGTTSPAYTLDVSGSSNFTDGQTIVGNITFPSGSFISSTNISGNIYISTLNDGILHLNDDGGEGDVWMLNGQNKLRIEGDTIITGSIHQSGTFYPNQIDWFSSSIGYDTGSYILTTTANGLTTYANYQDVATIINSGLLTTSSFNAYTGSSTSQFAGTASYATNALSASYAVSASYEINYETSSSYADFAVSASYALNADNAIIAQTASYVVLAQTASYVQTAQTASYVLNAVSSSFATTASYYGGSVTSASYALTASYSNTSTSASYALNATNAVSSSYALTASYATIAQTASFITASNVYGPYGSNSVISASYASSSTFSERTTQIDVYVLNQSGASIAKGVVVRITGSNTSSDTPRIVTASYENDNNSANTLGITTQTIANGANGYVITEGILTGVDTQAFTSGQLIYLGATGSIIGYAPVAPLHAVRLGEVIRHQSNNGSIYVRIDNGYELNELHDILITSASSGDLLVRSGSVWINAKQLTGSYDLTGSLTATSFTGSLFGTSSWASNATTATTASYVLNAVSASFATLAQTANTASYVQTAQTASYVLQAVSASFATTASYALQALSASWAPAGNPFPYNGDAQISGSLGVTGSFSIQTYDAILANAYVPAILISDGGRNIYDIFGTGSIDAGGRILIDNTGAPSLGWLSRTMFDSALAQSLNWQFRYLYDGTSAQSIDWGNRATFDASGNTSVDWQSRTLAASNTVNAIEWDYPTNVQAVGINSYVRKIVEQNTVTEDFSNFTVYASFNPDGEILKGVTFDASVADFDLVYLETDAKWYPVNMTTSSASRLLGIAWGVGTGKEKVLLEGTMVVNDSALTDTPQVIGIDHGLPIYIRTGTGTYMGTNPPATSGNYIRVLGHAYYQGVADAQYWVMKFRPSNNWYII